MATNGASARLNWDEFFIVLAVLYSSRGTCSRLRTACILVKNKKIVGAGYNGAVSGLENCDEVGHLMVGKHCLRTQHGERNAIDNSIADLCGATAYVIATPCLNCVKSLLQKGVIRIVYVGSYDNVEGSEYIQEMCRKKQVRLEQWASDPLAVFDLLGQALRRLKCKGGIFKELGHLAIG
ncbi:MAG: ComE operon protein 2 [Parcubacteria group bacterium GW2011_GWA2_47_8b]|uniref:ComE operon protein 2 n=2 Tax=Parcubacteria group TaxID=1794811 RepID=A0A0G1T5X0_9BACT|nr:MAG: ComE operon protein 2 [Candidatus Giovannonibacteria bacterium GW2011_GWB1_47_6b]KKU83493.1 MAG: ComE operon protein 2 [Parcubacteria group bacterium GW2011_GWA2_47_8b]KKU92696.1 MAG: ComE operon protein 2 [Parcubacteria group bacterium GW2011_GWA1_48_11b]OGY65027.1 MAG: hypothetical protein A3E64_00695 [Candidatus Harrisonbacteria bacterium RIFCSPHIGHO2_12_FULL_48_16]